MPSWLIIANPTSGRGASLRMARQAQRALEDHGAATTLALTTEKHHARHLAARAAAEGHSSIVVCGGDGTLNEVCAGLVDARATDRVRLAIMPSGTGNGVAASLGVRTARDGVAALVAGAEVAVDVWSVSGARLSVLAVGWGAVAEFDHLTEVRWRRAGPLRVPAAEAVVLARNRAYAGRVALGAASDADLKALDAGVAAGRLRRAQEADLQAGDCTHVVEGVFSMVQACNMAWLSADSQMAPGAQPSDGRLTAVIVHRRSRLGLLRGFLRLKQGTHVALGNVDMFPCTAMRIEPASSTADHVEVDGEPSREGSIAVTRHVVDGTPTAVRVLAAPARPPRRWAAGLTRWMTHRRSGGSRGVRLRGS